MKNYDEIKYALFCDTLEEQYKQAKEDGIFEVLRVLELDKEHYIPLLTKIGKVLVPPAPTVPNSLKVPLAPLVHGTYAAA